MTICPGLASLVKSAAVALRARLVHAFAAHDAHCHEALHAPERRFRKIQRRARLIDLIAEEDMVIAITQSGYIKRLPVTAYREQRRGGDPRGGEGETAGGGGQTDERDGARREGLKARR